MFVVLFAFHLGTRGTSTVLLRGGGRLPSQILLRGGGRLSSRVLLVKSATCNIYGGGRACPHSTWPLDALAQAHGGSGCRLVDTAKAASSLGARSTTLPPVQPSARMAATVPRGAAARCSTPGRTPQGGGQDTRPQLLSHADTPKFASSLGASSATRPAGDRTVLTVRSARLWESAYTCTRDQRALFQDHHQVIGPSFCQHVAEFC
jgi:hypothetical protein